MFISGYVLVKFIAAICLGCLVRTFEVVLAGGAAAVLFVDFAVLDESFEVCLCVIEIVLMASGLFSHSVISFLSKWFEAYICLR